MSFWGGVGAKRMEVWWRITDGFCIAAIVLGYVVARHLSGWFILAGFVTIPAIWAGYTYAQASNADADGQILAIVIYGSPAAAAFAGWAVGAIVGRIVKTVAAEARKVPSP
jgi:hypothetical protein